MSQVNLEDAREILEYLSRNKVNISWDPQDKQGHHHGVVLVNGEGAGANISYIDPKDIKGDPNDPAAVKYRLSRFIKAVRAYKAANDTLEDNNDSI